MGIIGTFIVELLTTRR